MEPTTWRDKREESTYDTNDTRLLRRVHLLLPALLGFGFTTLLLFVAVRSFPALKFLDFPERYHLKRKRLPYPIGVVAVLSFLVLFPTLFPVGMKEAGVLICVALLGIVSFIDDRTPLPAGLRLSLQVVLCLLVFAAGSRIYTITNPLGGIIKLDSLTLATPLFGPLPVLSGLFTVVWLCLTVNAMNWHDGVSGQVTSLSASGFLILACLALFRNSEPETARLALLLFGVSAACLLFDVPPPKGILGDSGSMFFGLMLGLLGIYHGGKVATALLILGIPLFDAALVIMGRIRQGRSPLHGNDDHLHHLLLKRGWGDRSIILLSLLAGTGFGLIALFSDTFVKALLLLLQLCLVALLRWYARCKSLPSNCN